MIGTVPGISAISPTVLAVSQTGGSRTGLFVDETDAGTLTPVDVDASTIGDEGGTIRTRVTPPEKRTDR